MKQVMEIVGIPSRTLIRRKHAGRLKPEESERLLRIINLHNKAIALFEGDRASAVRWLQTPQKALDDSVPLEYAKTEVGARAVEELIGRLEHGVFT